MRPAAPAAVARPHLCGLRGLCVQNVVFFVSFVRSGSSYLRDFVVVL